MWFEDLTGFEESHPEQVRDNLSLDGEVITSKVNHRSMVCGELETPLLSDLRERSESVLKNHSGSLSFGLVSGNVQDLHLDPANENALFQVASQFNLLEMQSPSYTPEDGIGIYENDRTQGPACAIACGAGTIFRNYFVPLGEGIGQTTDRQIDCLADLGIALGNAEGKLWSMSNGYAFPNEEGLAHVTALLHQADSETTEELRGKLRIGLQWGTEVTLSTEGSQRVTQAYCSALPVAYSMLYAEQWEAFGRLVLESAYEATFHSAILNKELTGNNALYLTQLGGGAFGNEPEWIIDAMVRSLKKFENSDLDVKLVSYRNRNPIFEDILRALK